MASLDARVEKDDAGNQSGERVSEEPETEVREDRHADGDADGVTRGFAVRDAAGGRSDKGSGGSDEAEESGRARAVVERGRSEPEDQGGPEDAEGAEEQTADEGGFPQQGLLADESEDGTQQVGVAEGDGGRAAGELAGEHGAEGGHQCGGHPVHGAPAEGGSDQAAGGAGEQDADEQAAKDCADNAAADFGSGNLGGEGKDEVRDNRGDSDERAGQGEKGKAGREGDQGCGGGGGQAGGDNEAAAFEDVAQRDEKEHSDGDAQLRVHGQVSGVAREGGPDLSEKRLVVVDIGDADSAGDGHDPDEAGHAASSLRGGRARDR